MDLDNVQIRIGAADVRFHVREQLVGCGWPVAALERVKDDVLMEMYADGATIPEMARGIYDAWLYGRGPYSLPSMVF